MSVETLEYTPKDFSSDQEVKWCPGCGDYAILKAVQKAMPEIGKKKEDIVFVSGIGCSSRFPYYMNTFGFHSIHGRAPALATGVKLANPNLSVWQITGDGDALAIGGNHFIHLIRRNVDINVLLFNNRIYGLTKGQFSPTTNLGQKTKSSPQGTIDNPFNPGELVIGANGKFFARATDTNLKQMTDIFIEAEKHKGASIVEIMQNCVIFNHHIYSNYTDKEVKEDNILQVEHGKPMIFGKESNKGLVLNGFKLQVVTLGENGITEKDILVHDAHEEDSTLHNMLAKLPMPIVTGVIRSVKDDTFEQRMKMQVEEVAKKSPYKSVDDLLVSGETWEIK
ncbi:MAG: 2-oxoacid:ferredoxin oxidoreductase subunit beta [Cyclobacteriaceae bacterium]|nr:2-oxoacid:ferredoxin oxidoreductase subunit beta [Cyclobacteriaceae bacterium]